MKKNLQKLKANYKADLRIFLEAHVSFVFICAEVTLHQIIKKNHAATKSTGRTKINRNKTEY